MDMRSPTQPAPKLSFWHPAHLIATWFGSGLLPRMPGTWGSLAALPFAWIMQHYCGSLALAIAILFAISLGLWAIHVYLQSSDILDPGPVVIDEVAGQWWTLMLVPADPWLYLLGFILFRVFDIAKPWPASWADRHMPGAAGVMLDDLFAGIYGFIIMTGITWSLGRL